MKKIFNILFVATIFSSCQGNKKTSIYYPTIQSFTHNEAINQLDLIENKNKVLYITDGRQLYDKSFNQIIWKGVVDYLGTSDEKNSVIPEYKPNEWTTVYDEGFKKNQLLVIGGFEHVTPLKSFVSKIPSNHGAILIDDKIKAKNVMSVSFKTEEVAFYAGYFAAKYLNDNSKKYDTKNSKGLKVGTYGGMNLAPVVAFMAGFQQGIFYWNNNLAKNQKKVDFIKLGNKAESFFSGNFNDGYGRPISEKLVNMGADVILPVAANQILDTLKVIEEKNTQTLVIGVDVDQSQQYKDEGYSNKFLTSILKNSDLAVSQGIKHIYKEKNNNLYGLGKVIIGTMENGLQSLAYGLGNILDEKQWLEIKNNPKLKKAAQKVKNEFLL